MQCSIKTETPHSWTNRGAPRPGRLSVQLSPGSIALLPPPPRVHRVLGDPAASPATAQSQGNSVPLLKSTLSLMIMSTLIHQENVELLGAAFYS